MAKKKTTKKKQKPAGREVAIKRDGTPSDENQRIAEAALLGTKVEPAEAVAEINRRWRSGVESVAEYLVTTYFAGDVEALGEGVETNAGLARLKEHEAELDISYSYLRGILRAQNQRHRLESDGLSKEARGLSLAHHMRVLSVNEDKKKIKLLEDATRKGWGVAALDAEAKKHRPERKPVEFTPRRALGWLDRADRLMAPATDDGLIEALGQLKGKERTAARKRLDAQIKTLEQARKAVAD